MILDAPLRLLDQADQHAHHADIIPALSVHGLTAGYPGDRRALEGADFEVLSGERVAVIGPNGAGKSTLFKALVGLIPFTAGEISIHGVDCHTSHTMIGYVPQHEEIDWTFPVSVWDVVMMGRTRHIGWRRFTRPQDRAIVGEMLDRVGMSAFAQRQIGQLSGGQKRRVFIARALAQETDVLLLDEPFTGVDASAEHEIMQVLDNLRGQGVTVVLATHDMGMAAAHFDKLLLLKQRVLAFGTAQEVLTPEVLARAYGGALRIFQNGQAVTIFADEHGCP